MAASLSVPLALPLANATAVTAKTLRTNSSTTGAGIRAAGKYDSAPYRAAEERQYEMSAAEGKYTLEYHPKDDADKQGPPFKYRTYYLDDALAEGWWHHQSGGSAVRIRHEEQSIYEKDELERMFARISQLAGLQPERPVRDIARQLTEEKHSAEVF